MAPPTILIVGATGNTGQETVRSLSAHLSTSPTFQNHRILAQTRSSSGAAAQQLAALPHVEITEQHWPDITSDWLRERNVTRAFIAPHNQPNQFAEESSFHIAALNAGVEYVVRISTTGTNVRPDNKAYYPRSHWAIEALLSTPEFAPLRWTSLQPNVFHQTWLYGAVQFVNAFRATGKQEKFLLPASEDAPNASVDADDVGVIAAKLLLLEDSTVHNKAKYVIHGPEDVTGRQIVELVEARIGKVEDVVFKDLSFIEYMAAAAEGQSKNVIRSIRYAVETGWNGETTASKTSKEILELAAPKRTAAEVFKAMLGE